VIRKSGGRFAETTPLNENPDVPPAAARESQRIDKWMWHARLVRTRSAALALANSGYVRINGARIRAPSRIVREGDVITVALDRRVRVLKVKAFAARRGGAAAGVDLYEEIDLK
jgi:ribosome-associated heat shock protein Hsp15